MPVMLTVSSPRHTASGRRRRTAPAREGGEQTCCQRLDGEQTAPVYGPDRRKDRSACGGVGSRRHRGTVTSWVSRHPEARDPVAETVAAVHPRVIVEAGSAWGLRSTAA